MTRIIKDYAVRRTEIMDAAQRLIFSKGYEQMTIQDILDDLKISKGAFYHYFSSKQNLLDALIDRIIKEVQQLIKPIMQDPQLAAIEKLHKFFDVTARWKSARKQYLMALLRIWYNDDNAIFRQKQIMAAVKEVTPLLAQIIRQGIEEGVFSTEFPDEMSEVTMSLMQNLGDSIITDLLSCEPKCSDLAHLEKLVNAYNDSIERVLGAAPGSLHLLDVAIFEEWFA